MSLQIPKSVLLARNLPCALCGSEKPRQLSHILPAFVFKHAQIRSPTGYLRTTVAPNKRVQDGPKDYILCRNCEQVFAEWEKPFSNIFKLHNSLRNETITYSRLDALCALSMVWRVLYNARSHPELNHLTFKGDYSRTDPCFSVWSATLLNGGNPGKFPLFWIFFGDIVGGSNLPENINRYIFHASDYDLMANSNESFVYVHIPGIFIVGMCEDYDKREWSGLKVGFNGGRYFQENKTVPGFIGQLIREKAESSLDAQSRISSKQKNRIAEDALRDPSKLINSLIARSLTQDMDLDHD